MKPMYKAALLGGALFSVAAVIGVQSQSQPDYYCYNNQTGDCYPHYPIFGPGCDKGYTKTYMPCPAVPTPTPTSTPAPTPTPTPTPEVPYVCIDVNTLFNGHNIYSPVLHNAADQQWLYYGGWQRPEDWPNDAIYMAKSYDEGTSWEYVGKVVSIADLPQGSSHANDPSVIWYGNKGYMAFTGAVWNPYPESRDSVWLATSTDGLHWSGFRKLIEDAGEPCLFVHNNSVKMLYSNRITRSIDMTTLNFASMTASTMRVNTKTLVREVATSGSVNPPTGRQYANPHAVQLNDGKWLLMYNDYGDATGKVVGVLADSPDEWDPNNAWVIWNTGERVARQPCGWYGASAVPYLSGFIVFAGEALWPTNPEDNCLTLGTKSLVRAVYWPAGQPPPEPTPVPTPWQPGCPEEPTLSSDGWYWQLDVVPNTGTRLVILGDPDKGTCYYLRHLTGTPAEAQAWRRYAASGPWTVQGLYPVTVAPDRVYRVEVYVPYGVNLWARVVRDVAPPEGGPAEIPPWTKKNPTN